MTSRFCKIALGTSCALMGLAMLPVSPAGAQSITSSAIASSAMASSAIVSPAQDISLSIGRGHLVNVPGAMADVFVANDSITDVQVKSARQLYVFGKSGGETTLYASNAAGDIIWSANIRVGNNIQSIDQMLALAMPEAKISVATMGNNMVLLTGTVAQPEDAAEVERLVTAFVGDGTNVVSRLRTATPLQVNLQVRFAEVNRTLVRALGANLQSRDSTGGFKFGISQGRANLAVNGDDVSVNGVADGTTIGGFGKFLGLDLTGALDLAEQNGLVTTLSQPNLTALSGEAAEFLAGGEYPIPVSNGNNNGVTIEYRKYGVSLRYAPTVLSNGRISMRVRPEVSELTSEGAVSIEGFQIPALTVRRAETTVELGSGQSFMIAGLLSNSSQNMIRKAPGLGDVPILGNLFKSTEFQKGQTELVIVVTPYLVKPVNANDIALPTDGFKAATATQQFFGGETGSTTEEPRPVPRLAAPEDGQPARSGATPDDPRNRAQDTPEETAEPGFSFE
ncbi:type II and III secretion system protein family protein [Altericroceibacterium spongiae]|uniref:Type II and III secretion system protein family protein n=1 Tax=Altericroceibacterium spongiae TaxID=2320269 RepID=A0A420EK71_9SPHN|nr:type II and III secretion system protein family protein [Altericroceibacterium spongiae]RKF21122.1 type II and III secretion system protein family protein [Altericroceibacterium spongiae]